MYGCTLYSMLPKWKGRGIGLGCRAYKEKSVIWVSKQLLKKKKKYCNKICLFSNSVVENNSKMLNAHILYTYSTKNSFELLKLYFQTDTYL